MALTTGPCALPHTAAATQTDDLSLAYGRSLVVDTVQLTLPPGRLTAVVGPNGCGKSTLLAGLSRLHRPAAGAVLLDGRALARLPAREAARRIGLLPQSADAPDGLTVADLVRFGRQPHQGLLRQWSPQDQEAVDPALVVADMAALADRPLETLSGGQRQRAWIAEAVAQDTAVLLLDEPTAALDLGHQLEVCELLRGLAAAGRTVVVVVHDLDRPTETAPSRIRRPVLGEAGRRARAVVFERAGRRAAQACRAACRRSPRRWRAGRAAR